jgi:hypothetical protein
MIEIPDKVAISREKNNKNTANVVLKMYKNIFHGVYFFKKSCFLFLATEQAPKFIREIKEVRLKEGMRGRFEAVFAGNPKPEITWYFQGKQLENSKNVQIKVHNSKT